MNGRVLQSKHEGLNRRALASAKGRPLHSYTDRRDDGTIASVRCKGCDVLLVKGGRALKEYAEMTTTFNDDSAHVTPMCRRCAVRKYSVAELERLYMLDTLELYDEDTSSEGLMKMMLACRPARSARTFVLGQRRKQ